MYYTSNKRGYFYPSSDIFHFEKECGIRKWYLKTSFFVFYFLIVHISASFLIGGLKFGMRVTHIGVEAGCLLILKDQFKAFFKTF